MSKVSMEIDGEKFTTSLENYKLNIEKRLPELVATTVSSIEQDAKRIADQKGIYDTGNLIEMITSKASGLEGEVSANAEYSFWQEYGTYKQPARPFMRPSYDLNVKRMNEALKNLFKG